VQEAILLLTQAGQAEKISYLQDLSPHSGATANVSPLATTRFRPVSLAA
jgi:hypothetical protein